MTKIRQRDGARNGNQDGDADATAPNWKKWSLWVAATLPQAVALACNLDPDNIAVRWHGETRLRQLAGDMDPVGLAMTLPPLDVYRETFPEGRIEMFLERLEVAANHVEEGTLAATFRSVEASVRLVNFASWAERLGWTLPGGFPRGDRPIAPDGERHDIACAESTVGVVVQLPHLTKTLEALFKVMREHWSAYDPRNPPKSAVVAADIDAALGWQSQRGGEPSRGAQTLAAAIRPDEISDADVRTRKRSRGPSGNPT